MKPGWQTSEFWLSVFSTVASVGAVAAGVVPGPIGLAVAGATTGAYTIARAVVKSRKEQPNDTTTTPSTGWSTPSTGSNG